MRSSLSAQSSALNVNQETVNRLPIIVLGLSESEIEFHPVHRFIENLSGIRFRLYLKISDKTAYSHNEANLTTKVLAATILPKELTKRTKKTFKTSELL